MRVFTGTVAVLLLAGPVLAAGADAPREPLVVAVRESPPFAMRDVAGNWEGLSVTLWQDVADQLGLEFTWQEMELQETLRALESGAIDVATTALTITPDRERRLDFSHPYLVSGLTLAFPADRGSAWLETLRGFASLEFLSTVASLALVLLIAGVAVWVFERRRNPEEFGGSTLKGLGSGFWWSAVTMTTVGYGDKAPKTLGGRIVGLVWMFVSILIIASFTGAIAASVTVNRLGADLLRDRSLRELSIGVVQGSASAGLARERGLRVRGHESLEDAIRAMEAGSVDVVLHDEPILRHLQRAGDLGEFAIAPRSLVRHDYGFGLPPGSALREPVNNALLSILNEPIWREIRQRYLGAQEE